MSWKCCWNNTNQVIQLVQDSTVCCFLHALACPLYIIVLKVYIAPSQCHVICILRTTRTKYFFYVLLLCCKKKLTFMSLCLVSFDTLFFLILWNYCHKYIFWHRTDCDYICLQVVMPNGLLNNIIVHRLSELVSLFLCKHRFWHRIMKIIMLVPSSVHYHCE